MDCLYAVTSGITTVADSTLLTYRRRRDISTIRQTTVVSILRLLPDHFKVTTSVALSTSPESPCQTYLLSNKPVTYTCSTVFNVAF